MQEITSKRGWNRKVFDNEDGTQLYRFRVRHCHYKDEAGNFQDIDPRLTFDNTAKKWKHNKSSYSCEIPEYADEEMDFRTKYEGANFNAKFKAGSASHILGEYVENSEGNYILYTDAFGTGIDLRIYSYWKGIKKVVVARVRPTIQQIQKFNYELILPNNEDVLVDDDTWDKNSTLNARGKRIKIKDSNNKLIWFNQAHIYDSNTPPWSATLDIELTKSANKYLIKKNVGVDVPVADLVYPVYLEL